MKGVMKNKGTGIAILVAWKRENCLQSLKGLDFSWVRFGSIS